MLKRTPSLKFTALTLMAAVSLAACSDVSHTQKASPNKQYKDYVGTNKAIIGIGSPIDERQAKANATVRMVGQYTLQDAMKHLARTYSVAVRWDDSVRKTKRSDILAADLSFDEVRNYLEDVYGVQIIREGERRLLVVPTRKAARIKEFNPGVGVPLTQVVRGLSEQCGYNIVITENRSVLSSTRITTSFKDVDCHDAFDAVLAPNGLSLVDEGGHYTIGGLPQRQWVLNLYEPVRKDKQEVTYSSGISGEGDDSGTNAESGGSASSETSGERDLWKELEADLTDLVDKSCDASSSSSSALESTTEPAVSDPFGDASTASLETSTEESSTNINPECGYVRINRTVGLVQLRAPQRILNQADEVIRRVEDIASRRLVVDARIMAVSRERTYGQGGQFGYKGKHDGVNHGIGFDPSEGTNDPISITGALSDLVASDGFVAGVGGSSLDAAIEVLESFGTTYQLMQPTMEVMDRQRAVMIDGTNRRYVIRTASTDSDTGLTETNTEIESQFVGIQFSVVAQIAEQGEPHTVSLQIPITDIDDTLEVAVSGLPGEVDQIPVATTRLIDQKVRIRDGEIKVIGGLTKTVAVDKESGVPLIRSVPVGGKLFNEESITYENLEFVVLLRVKRIY